jgi:hypothetical protein
MSSYTSIDELKLIIERAKKLGDTEYAVNRTGFAGGSNS